MFSVYVENSRVVILNSLRFYYIFFFIEQKEQLLKWPMCRRGFAILLFTKLTKETNFQFNFFFVFNFGNQKRVNKVHFLSSMTL